MRKVIANLFISIDGVVESPDQWQFDVFDEDMGQAMVEAIGKVDTVLLGRVTYEEWADYWPGSDDDTFAPFINNVPKYVVSTTLDSVAWGDKGNVHLIKGDPREEIEKLKQQPGGDIAINGSPTLVRRLLYAGLLDELVLMVHPVVVNAGKRLFQEGDDLKRLTLAHTGRSASGVVFLTYIPRT